MKKINAVLSDKSKKRYYTKGYITLYLNVYIAEKKALYVLSAGVSVSASLETDKDDAVLDADIKKVNIDFCEKCACDLGTKDTFLSESDKDFNDVMQMNNGMEITDDEKAFLLSFLEDADEFKDCVTEAIEESSLLDWEED